jgi:hypothetical protein
MNRGTWTSAVLSALLLGAMATGAPPCGKPDSSCAVHQFAPAGGWFPYGGGLLHWWNPQWFPRCGGPDDYDRKCLPHIWLNPCPCAPALPGQCEHPIATTPAVPVQQGPR